MAGYDARRIARVKRLMGEGLKAACIHLGEPLAAKRFSIVNPSPAKIYGETQEPFVLHIDRDALASEGVGRISEGMSYSHVEPRSDDEIRNLRILRQAAVTLVRALRREREIALHSPGDANPGWSCHVHHVLKAMLDLAEREAGISPALCLDITGQHDPRTPFIARPNVTRWAQAARGRWRECEIDRTTLSAGRVSTPRLKIRFGHEVQITSMFYTDVAAVGVTLPETTAVALRAEQNLPLRSLIDMPGFEFLPDLETRSIWYTQNSSGEMTLRPVLKDERVLLGRPPAAADMSFLTIGSDLIDEDLTVTWPA
jgi:hypothetical protein